MRVRPGVTAVAALLAWAAALALTAPNPVRAHEDHHHHAPAASKADDADAPAAPAVGNRWGRNYFPNVELTTQHGTKVRLYDDLLKGKTVAINLFFADCVDVCPLATAKLMELRNILGERVGRDIVFYSISIDPEHDTPEVLRAYAAKYGVGPETKDWLFLTGKLQDIKLASKRLGLVRGSDLASRDGHSTLLLIGDEARGVWTRAATTDNPEFLALRIATALGWRELPVPVQSYADARPLRFKKGEDVFQTLCVSCHTVGQGDKVGPDLRDVIERRDIAWLARYIRVPEQVLAEGDPIATELLERYNRIRMPNLNLTREQVNAVLSYLDLRSRDLDREARTDSKHSHR